MKRRRHYWVSYVLFIVGDAAERQDVRTSELEAPDLLCGRHEHALHRGVRHADTNRASQAVHGLPRVRKPESMLTF